MALPWEAAGGEQGSESGMPQVDFLKRVCLEQGRANPGYSEDPIDAAVKRQKAMEFHQRACAVMFDIEF
ncbi:MAG TPA: hypothetical protein DD433_09710 [Ruminococcaceae bacterium]|nr:hypothetical protein [Oscillospiraceae bacterium]